MSRHLADRPRDDEGGRVKHFLRLSREGRSDKLWAEAGRKPADGVKDSARKDRRMVEFLRIDRGRTA